MNVVAGFDLSLRASAFCALSSDWGCDWSRAIVGGTGQPLPKDAAEALRLTRLKLIRNAALEFVKDHHVRIAVVEQYAFTALTSQAHALGELGGVVKTALLEAGCVVEVVSPASARKLLGKQPRKDAKIWAAQKLYSMGAPRRWTLDHCDAFLIANYYLAGSGGDAVALEAA
ncbi:MAG TPA: hypothetical protein VGP93_17265 [Polyangiaceae bacterium]|nr:hypothetical protein [Polyangiaceae bacterium]